MSHDLMGRTIRVGSDVVGMTSNIDTVYVNVSTIDSRENLEL